jgi:hypothetical protein
LDLLESLSRNMTGVCFESVMFQTERDNTLI